MRRLEGKRVVVTGGTSGIGAAVSRRFMSEGARVVSIALGGEEPVDGLAGALEADVADPDAVAGAFARVDELLGGLDVLVSNAGISVRHGFLDITAEEWRRVVAVNPDGRFHCAPQAARRVGGGGDGGGGGGVLLAASTKASGGRPDYAPHHAANAGRA